MDIIIVSGYFNPLHKGHIEYFEKSREHGDSLVVIVNNDVQRELKGSKAFQKEDERMLIISSLKMVGNVFLSIDTDRTVRETLRIIRKQYPNDNLYFANGGDQNNDIIPEREICNELGIELVDGLGEKIQSSSWLLKKD